MNTHNITATLRSVKFGGTEITPDENGLYTVTGLEPDTSYEIVVTYETAEGEERSQTETVRTKELVIDASNSTTQTTATLKITASEDESCSPTKKGIIFDGKTYECKDDKVVLTDLVPGRIWDRQVLRSEEAIPQETPMCRRPALPVMTAAIR